MALTPKQERFVGEYLKDLNATQAAIRAERTQVEGDQVVLELARNGFSDMREIALWGPDGIAYKASGELTDEVAATVAEITETVTPTKDGGERRTLKIKLHNKLRALELLGRHLGIFTDKVQMALPPDGFTIRLIGLPEKPRGPVSGSAPTARETRGE